MIKKLLGLPLFVSVLVVSPVNAAIVAIDSMFVETASATLDLYGSYPPPPVTATGGFSPAVEITMGSYQPTLLSFGNASSLYVNIYSTGAYGMSAPSGTVDTTLGTISSLDFSSLRADVSYNGINYANLELWPLTTTLDTGTYDPMTGNYTATWTETFSILFSSNNSLSVTLDGYLTTVPVPAAVWLFGSGLLALFGFAKSRKH